MLFSTPELVYIVFFETVTVAVMVFQNRHRPSRADCAAIRLSFLVSRSVLASSGIMLAARQLQIGPEYGLHTICISFMRRSRFIKQSTYENRKKTADKGHKNDPMRRFRYSRAVFRSDRSSATHSKSQRSHTLRFQVYKGSRNGLSKPLRTITGS